MSIDPRLLATFRAVVEAGGISAAARALHLSQPAVTAQVKHLEEQCGRPLLLRSQRGVAPTAEGRALLPYAERIERLLGEAQDAIGRRGGGERLLSLAASTTIASYVLPGLVARFLAENQGLRVDLRVGNTADVLASIHAGKVPFGFVEGPSRVGGLRLEPFLDDELVPVLSSTSPPGLRRLRHVRALLTAPLIMREPGSGTRVVVERALAASIGRRRAVPGDLVLGSTEAIKRAALAGLGIAFLSRWTIGAELAMGRLEILRLGELRVCRRLSFAMPASAVAGLAGRFVRFARLVAPTLQP